jgi:hypothetical protein
MLRRSNLVSSGSVAFARPLGTVRTLYPDMSGLSRGFLKWQISACNRLS